jgi:hypothetical protein
MVVHLYPAVDVGVWKFVQHPMDVRGVGLHRLRDLGDCQAIAGAQKLTN